MRRKDMHQALAYRQPHDVVDVGSLTRQADEARAETARALDTLVAQLDAGAATDEPFDFAGLITVSKKLLMLEDLEMSRLLKTSRPNVGRWARGVSSPHPIARRAVLQTLAKEARAKAKAARR